MIRMIERRQQLCFSLEASHALGIANKTFRQHLYYHVTIHPRVMTPIDIAHAACADERGDVVGL